MRTRYTLATALILTVALTLTVATPGVGALVPINTNSQETVRMEEYIRPVSQQYTNQQTAQEQKEQLIERLKEQIAFITLKIQRLQGEQQQVPARVLTQTAPTAPRTPTIPRTSDAEGIPTTVRDSGEEGVSDTREQELETMKRAEKKRCVEIQEKFLYQTRKLRGYVSELKRKEKDLTSHLRDVNKKIKDGDFKNINLNDPTSQSILDLYQEYIANISSQNAYADPSVRAASRASRGRGGSGVGEAIYQFNQKREQNIFNAKLQRVAVLGDYTNSVRKSIEDIKMQRLNVELELAKEKDQKKDALLRAGC